MQPLTNKPIETPGSPTVHPNNLRDRLIAFLDAGGDINQAKKLVEAGADVNTQNSNGLTILHIYCLYGTLEDIKGLISRGADLNKANKYGKTPLDCCLERFCLLMKQNDPEVNFLDMKILHLTKNPGLKPPTNREEIEQYRLLIPSEKKLASLLEIAEFLLDNHAACSAEESLDFFTYTMRGMDYLVKFNDPESELAVDWTKTQLTRHETQELTGKCYLALSQVLKKMVERHMAVKTLTSVSPDAPLYELLYQARQLDNNPLKGEYFSLVEHLLKKIPDIDRIELKGETLLFYTGVLAKEAKRGKENYIRLIKLLIANGAEPFHISSTGLAIVELCTTGDFMCHTIGDFMSEILMDHLKSWVQTQRLSGSRIPSSNHKAASVTSHNLRKEKKESGAIKQLEQSCKVLKQQQKQLKQVAQTLGKAEKAFKQLATDLLTPKQNHTEDNFNHLKEIFAGLANYHAFQLVLKEGRCHITCDSKEALDVVYNVLRQKRWEINASSPVESEIIIDKLEMEIYLPKHRVLKTLQNKFERMKAPNPAHDPQPADEADEESPEETNILAQKLTEARPLIPPQDELDEFSRFEKERLAYENRAHRKEEEIWNAAKRAFKADKELPAEPFDWVKHCQKLIEADPERNTSDMTAARAAKPKPKPALKPAPQTPPKKFTAPESDTPRAAYPSYTPQRAPAPLAFNLGHALNRSSQVQFRKDRLRTSYNHLISIGDIHNRAFGNNPVYAVDQLDWARLIVRYSLMYNMLRFFESLHTTSSNKGERHFDFEYDINRFVVSQRTAHQTRNDVRNCFECITDQKLFECAKQLSSSGLAANIASLLKSPNLPDQLPVALDISLYDDPGKGNLSAKTAAGLIAIMGREAAHLEIFCKPYKDQLFKLYTEDSDRLAAAKMSIAILSKCYKLLPDQIKKAIPEEDRTAAILTKLGNAVSHVIGDGLEYYHYEEIQSHHFNFLAGNISEFVHKLEGLAAKEQSAPSSASALIPPPAPKNKFPVPNAQVMEAFHLNLIKNDLGDIVKNTQGIKSAAGLMSDPKLAAGLTKSFTLVFKILAKLQPHHFAEGGLFSDPFFKSCQGRDFNTLNPDELFALCENVRALLPKIQPASGQQ